MGRVITSTAMGGNKKGKPQKPNKNTKRPKPPVPTPNYEDLNCTSSSRNSCISEITTSGELARLQNVARKEVENGYNGIMAHKKYCCSNTPQVEAKIWAVCDTICATLVFIVIVYFLYVLKSDRQFLEDLIALEPKQQRDLDMFLQYSDFKQDVIIVVAIMRQICSIFLGALLYLSAVAKCHQQLKIWLISTFVAIIVDLILFIPKMVHTQNKLTYVSLMIGYFVYKWYEVWIVTILFKEIRCQEQAMAEQTGENNATFDADEELIRYTETREQTVTPPANVRFRDDSQGQVATITSKFQDYGGGFYKNNMGSFILSEPPKKLQFRGNTDTSNQPVVNRFYRDDDVEIFRY